MSTPDLECASTQTTCHCDLLTSAISRSPKLDRKSASSGSWWASRTIMTTTLRPRNGSVKSFAIHHDQMDGREEDHDMDDSRMEEPEEDDDAYSDTSEESDGTIDPAVQEDMDKFQETFKGIKNRYRLINRIGEGVLLDSLSFRRC